MGLSLGMKLEGLPSARPLGGRRPRASAPLGTHPRGDEWQCGTGEQDESSVGPRRTGR